ncbi:serine/threonine protein phosphatase 1 [Paenibacillus sp. PastF-1]|uniref:metallophosphoesterase family protein n=1 Tax=unclassified Paenibacillus TaxID=185978 RepID=UPI002405AA3D|nr:MULTISPECIES: metallophosphoesterase family protein [unclassified Paenibacillus]MDF9840412.1 serine/threonine protein phosphatase 1 [Paenibacillus sp. PastF-2]MDF9846994.1 serine/threonine protein phosphatase 1 [Paenibacillus sp. PastM-2]MDF9853566.1 serine/threonine protein phosphatase 1 [Paenibacillus sp. PastF-1]MDH6478948.1 serine/threonine protein phosphatase 1 [Paenibacillus sp. PastH-2]MDH6506680.1 serine/threonine protein phosphatase 1 [Paenibacillus sp. PastM-3]
MIGKEWKIIRTLVISDIHGCYREFNALLRKADYNPGRDKLALIGDYVDRGPNSKAIVDQVMSLHAEYGAVVLKGNHDKMACDALLSDDEDKLDLHWLNNGGFYTLASYVGADADFVQYDLGWAEYIRIKHWIRQVYKHHLDFLSSLPLYHETEDHLFVHAGIDPALADWRTQKDYDFIWIREPFYNHPVTSTGKTVVFGHTPTFEFQHDPGIWFSPHGDKIGIDGGCAYGEQLNCLEIGEEGYKSYNVRLGESS